MSHWLPIGPLLPSFLADFFDLPALSPTHTVSTMPIHVLPICYIPYMFYGMQLLVSLFA